MRQSDHGHQNIYNGMEKSVLAGAISPDTQIVISSPLDRPVGGIPLESRFIIAFHRSVGSQLEA
jgi:hypothetical protein